MSIFSKTGKRKKQDAKNLSVGEKKAFRYKTCFLLILQLAMVLEYALIIKGYFDIEFNPVEILFIVIVNIFFITRTIKVINRQQK